MRDKIQTTLGKRVILFDGAFGTELQKRGLKAGDCPDMWNVTHPEAVKDIYRNYAEAGSDVITANTFGATRLKLADFHLETHVREINTRAIELARAAVGDNVWIAADMGPTGKLIQPMGNTSFDEVYETYAEQVQIFQQVGVDLVIIETMSDIREVKAALMAVSEVSKLPCIVSMTFEPTGRTTSGTDPESFATMVAPYNPLAIGANCGVGPRHMLPIIQELIACTSLPIIAQPNAGLPRLDGFRTIFDMPLDEYLNATADLVKAGVWFIGGCCGTNPEHIKKLRELVAEAVPLQRQQRSGLALSSRAKTHWISDDAPFTLIGERINPTGRKAFSKELREGNLQRIIDDAQTQLHAGAHVLDVNIGVPGVDEPALMERAVYTIQNIVPLPLCLDSANPKVLEAGCSAYAGKPLLNSVNGERERLEQVLPIAKRFGTGLICLTMDEKGIPEGVEARLTILRRIMELAQQYGIQPHQLLVDCLTLTIGSQPRQAKETLRTIARVRDEFGLPTVLGVSNVSFGMPDRPFLSSAFLNMAIAYGLDSGIINPLQEQMIAAIKTGEALTGRDRGSARYIEFCAQKTAPAQPLVSTSTPEAPTMDARQHIRDAILFGNSTRIQSRLEAALKTGIQAQELIDGVLIPTMNEVGKKYETGEFFLPQLILAGETMQSAFAYLRPLLSESAKQQAYAGKIVFATVKGDIHDIGKNIVSIVFRNLGFEVIDLGKDVPAEIILTAVEQQKPDICALSSLMTTTMPEMAGIVAAVRDRFPETFTMVGGAVVTQRYATEIGAHGYAPDAVSAGKKAIELTKNKH